MYQIVLSFAVLLFFLCSPTPCQALELFPKDDSSKREKKQEIKGSLFNSKNEDPCRDKDGSLSPCPH